SWLYALPSCALSWLPSSSLPCSFLCVRRPNPPGAMADSGRNRSGAITLDLTPEFTLSCFVHRAQALLRCRCRVACAICESQLRRASHQRHAIESVKREARLRSLLPSSKGSGRGRRRHRFAEEMTSTRLRDHHRDEFGDAGRALGAFERDRRFRDDAHALRRLLDLGEADLRLDAAAAWHRLREAHLVAAVIEPRRHLAYRIDAVEQARHQREGEEAMRDRRAEGRGLGALAIDMDPLVVAGRLGEAIDHLLGHLDPFALAEHLSDRGLELLHIGEVAHREVPFASLNRAFFPCGPRAVHAISQAAS